MSAGAFSADDARTMATALEKVSTADFSAGGKLEPEQFEQFFNDLQDQSSVLDMVRSLPVNAESGAIPRLDVGSRLFQSVSEGSRANLQTIDQPDVSYQNQKVSLPWELTHEAATENVIGSTLEQQIRALFTNQFSNDLEILASVGDETTTGFTAINDGWLTIAASRGSPTYNHEEDTTDDATTNPTPQPIDKSLFGGMLQTLDDKYIENGGLVFMLSHNQKQEYKQYLTDRSTGAGDAMLMTGEEPTPYGYDIVTPLAWPDDQAMLVNPQNLVYLLQDDLRVKTTTEGEHATLDDVDVIYNMLAKFDYQILDEAGLVVGNGIEAPA